jgi:hypothetical protein
MAIKANFIVVFYPVCHKGNLYMMSTFIIPQFWLVGHPFIHSATRQPYVVFVQSYVTNCHKGIAKS